LTFEFNESTELFIGVHDKAISVAAMGVCNDESSSEGIPQQSPLLEHVEQFEDDHDNDNYSDYVEDASVYARDLYQRACDGQHLSGRRR